MSVFEVLEKNFGQSFRESLRILYQNLITTRKKRINLEPILARKLIKIHNLADPPIQNDSFVVSNETLYQKGII